MEENKEMDRQESRGQSMMVVKKDAAQVGKHKLALVQARLVPVQGKMIGHDPGQPLHTEAGQGGDAIW